MNTTICLDFGNTRLKYAVFENTHFKNEGVLANGSVETIKTLLDKYKPQKTILSSVVEHDIAIEDLLSAQTRFHKLSHLTTLNFTAPVSKPQTIGADRLALVAAAVHFYPNKNNVVIGLGSCITYNFINQNHEFLGGAISPGMEMRFKSMHDHTALLPLVNPEWNFPVIGYDTKTNLQSGVIAGMAYEIDGFINFYKSRYDNLNIVLTGGDATYFASQLKNKIFTDPDFLFKGLYALSEINNG
ncbi:MAG TPA: type III pantothenate kinase [Ferruginibacter sp.]|jgi:type III pantothenate kinase|nr:type III pantothenate kinase [Ferruginibacter sp.]